MPVTTPSQAPAVQLALVGGRVVDPETGHDAIADVGIANGRIVRVGPDLGGGDEVIDCTGLVVCPGFVDLHSHAQSLPGARLQVLDGVTTALDLECGALRVAEWHEKSAAEGRPLNYGYSASWALARAEVLGGPTVAPACHETGFAAFQTMLGSSAWRGAASRDERERVLRILEEEVSSGAIGVGAMLGYLPDSDPEEFLEVAALGAKMGSTVAVHSRSSSVVGPRTALAAVDELVTAAERTGAHVHLCHVNSTSSSWLPRILDAIAEAPAGGQRLTTEVYPYSRGSTAIGAAFLSPAELAREGREPRSLTYLGTGETIVDDRRLAELRAADPAGLVLTTTYDETDPAESGLFDLAMSVPHAAFASDAMPVAPTVTPGDSWPLPAGSFAHPRSAGCFTRVFRSLVRERGLLSLPDAIRRCTLVPAQLISDAAPAMRRKGRIQPGADADVVAFDPHRVTDRATYVDLLPSTGVQHVLVGGTAVVRDGRLLADALPGQAVTAASGAVA